MDNNSVKIEANSDKIYLDFRYFPDDAEVIVTILGPFGSTERELNVDECEQVGNGLLKFASQIRATEAGKHDTDDEKVVMALIDKFVDGTSDSWEETALELFKVARQRRGK